MLSLWKTGWIQLACIKLYGVLKITQSELRISRANYLISSLVMEAAEYLS